jgi:uncharacterized protein YeaO (DUF488 family)
VIRLKRIHDQPEASDGFRVLVDGMWPRGIGKGEAGVDEWLREIAPSRDLRRWFAHDPAKFGQFCRRYAAELDARPEAVERLLGILRGHDPVTLLFAARDREHNNAVALLRYLRERGFVVGD